MGAEYESERTATRDEATVILQEFADGVATGMLVFDSEDGHVTVDVPNEMEVELELESENGRVSVELELEWEAPPDGDAVSAIEALAESSAESEELPVGQSEDEGSLAHFEIFRDKADEWRWRLVHRNGNVIASSGEGYTRKHNAIKGLQSVRRNSPGAEIVDQSDG